MQLQMQAVVHGEPSQTMVEIGAPHEILWALNELGVAPLNGLIKSRDAGEELILKLVGGEIQELPSDSTVDYTVDLSAGPEIYVDPDEFAAVGAMCALHRYIKVVPVLDVSELPPLVTTDDND